MELEVLPKEVSQAETESASQIPEIHDANTTVIPQDSISSTETEEYPGDFEPADDTPEGGYIVDFPFPDPYLMVCFFDKDIINGQVTLHPWQLEVLESLGKAECSSKDPFKYCLVAANGSGKDKYILAPFAVWFILCKIRSRVIITTSSGTQLTSQTEPYIKDLCEKINAEAGTSLFLIRQRYIRCTRTGSEIRMFATDEAGKAEGYHPIDANSEMAIVVNEGKSVTEDIHKALRRCTGFNYWLEVSSAGEPRGFFYDIATKPQLGFTTKRVTSYDCDHVSQSEIQIDLELDGETSAFFRSKHLSLFTSIEGQAVISLELINDLLANPPKFTFDGWPLRVGIDLAAGGDENAICIIKGNKVLKEYWFREKDTMISAARIEQILKDEKIPTNHQHIYADSGGVGKGIVDNLIDKGWNVSPVMNQWPALGNKKQYGNRGAENWYRVKRILEERFFDLTGLTGVTLNQLCNRYYKQSLTGGRIFLEQKSEAKAHGRPSPDRADAFVLALTGISLDDYLNADKTAEDKVKIDERPKIKLHSPDEVVEHYENEVTFGRKFNLDDYTKQSTGSRFPLASLRKVIRKWTV